MLDNLKFWSKHRQQRKQMSHASSHMQSLTAAAATEAPQNVAIFRFYIKAEYQH